MRSACVGFLVCCLSTLAARCEVCVGERILGEEEWRDWRVVRGASTNWLTHATDAYKPATGFVLRMDESKTADKRFMTVACRQRHEISLDGSKIVLTLQEPHVSPLSAGVGIGPGLMIADSRGEVFQFHPKTIHKGETSTEIVYEMSPRGWNDSWGTRKDGKDGNPDSPLVFKGFNFGYAREGLSGEIRLLRCVLKPAVTNGVICHKEIISFVPDGDMFTARWNPGAVIGYRDGTFAVEAVRQKTLNLHYNRYPGCRPFPGMQRIILRTEGAFLGTAELNLRKLRGGERRTFTAECRTNAVFETNLPAENDFQLESIVLRFRGEIPAEGWNVRLTGLEGIRTASCAEACELDVETGDPLHLCPADSGRAAVVLRNSSECDLKWKGEVILGDLFDHKVLIPVDADVRAGGLCRLPLNTALPGKGLWRCFGKIYGSDGSVCYPETRFAVLDRHEIGPALPDGTFRMGINYHYGRFTPHDKRMTMRALVACGAKHTRVDAGMWSIVQGNGPDTWNWESSDAMVDDFERHGITIDSIVWGCPRWAATKTHQENRAWQHWWMGKPAETNLAACARYYETLARRYGTRIAYYEIGNEWDLRPKSVFTLDEAVDIQKLVYTALKRGCKDAVVIPNGWACWDSTVTMAKINEPEFPEKFMQRTHGFYDAHAVHYHCAFHRFRKHLTERFFPRRKSMGIDDVPWYANETALSSVHGNEIAVAENVWKKILFAFAYGSRDYIWYNLKATGWKPEDPEQGYGLMTADYYPRAGYAAFSALAAVIEGFGRDAILKSAKTREVYRFRRCCGNECEIVLAGWDDAVFDETLPLPVKTDAMGAEIVDFMGNRRSVPLSCGCCTWPLGRRPTALVLKGGRSASIDKDALDDIPEGLQKPIRIGKGANRAADFVVDGVRHVTGFYEGNPATVGRVWQGAADCSFRAWFERTDAALEVHVDVTDDVHVQRADQVRKMSEGDCLRMTLSVPGRRQLWELGFRLTESGKCESCIWEGPSGFPGAEKSIGLSAVRDGTVTKYRIVLPLNAFGLEPKDISDGVEMALRVDDNDGEGRDLWMGTETPSQLIWEEK